MSTLLERFGEHARQRGSLAAVRARDPGGWSFLSWGELDAEVGRRVSPAGEAWRGRVVEWDAPGGCVRRAVDLALQHLGAVGAWRAGAPDPLPPGRELVGVAVRLRGDARPRDPAARRGDRTLDHAGVLHLAERAAGLIQVRDGEECLVTADGAVEQVVAWAGVVAGFPIALAGADDLPTVAPAVWVCDAAALLRLTLPRSRVGTLGRWVRARGRADGRVGPALRRVVVAGEADGERVAALRDRGIEVGRWLEA